MKNELAYVSIIMVGILGLIVGYSISPSTPAIGQSAGGLAGVNRDIVADLARKIPGPKEEVNRSAEPVYTDSVPDMSR